MVHVFVIKKSRRLYIKSRLHGRVTAEPERAVSMTAIYRGFFLQLPFCIPFGKAKFKKKWLSVTALLENSEMSLSWYEISHCSFVSWQWTFRDKSVLCKLQSERRCGWQSAENGELDLLGYYQFDVVLLAKSMKIQKKKLINSHNWEIFCPLARRLQNAVNWTVCGGPPLFAARQIIKKVWWVFSVFFLWLFFFFCSFYFSIQIGKRNFFLHRLSFRLHVNS